MKRKVLLVDDHKIIIDGLKIFIEGIDGYEVVGWAHKGEDAVLKVKELNPDVVLLDHALPDYEGIELIPLLLQISPSLKIIVLTSFGVPELIIRAINAGAKAYLSKNVEKEELRRVLNDVFEKDHVWLDTGLTKKLINSIDPINVKDYLDLSDLEKKLITLVANGRSNKEIASSLHVTDQTIKNYLSKLYKKLGTRNRAEAATFAIKHKIV